MIYIVCIIFITIYYYSIQQYTNHISILLPLLLQLINTIEYGSIAHIKHGTAGITAETDKFPYFNKTIKSWLHLLWHEHPSEWQLLLLQQRLGETKFSDIPEISDISKISGISENQRVYIRDITDVYMELPPSVSFRVYINSNSSGSNSSSGNNNNNNVIVCTEQQEDNYNTSCIVDTTTNNNTTSTTTTTTVNSTPHQSYNSTNKSTTPTTSSIVLRITPVPNARGHAIMYVDAIYAAMQIQCYEPEEEVNRLFLDTMLCVIMLIFYTVTIFCFYVCIYSCCMYEYM